MGFDPEISVATQLQVNSRDISPRFIAEISVATQLQVPNDTVYLGYLSRLYIPRSRQIVNQTARISTLSNEAVREETPRSGTTVGEPTPVRHTKL